MSDEELQVEIESFYTPPLLQTSDEQKYDRQNENEISYIAKIALEKIVKDSRIENIVFENIRLNATKLSREDIEIQLTDCGENDFKVI